MTSKVLPWGAGVPAGREMNIVSFTALRFGNLAIISAWTIEEMLSGKKATHRRGLGLMLQRDLDLPISLLRLPFPLRASRP